MSKNKTVRNVFFAIFCLFACVSLGYAESCSSSGSVQYKYTASGCSYTTQTRTCCSNGSWSDWDKDCSLTVCRNGEVKEIEITLKWVDEYIKDKDAYKVCSYKCENNKWVFSGYSDYGCGSADWKTPSSQTSDDGECRAYAWSCEYEGASLHEELCNENENGTVKSVSYLLQAPTISQQVFYTTCRCGYRDDTGHPDNACPEL